MHSDKTCAFCTWLELRNNKFRCAHHINRLWVKTTVDADGMTEHFEEPIKGLNDFCPHFARKTYDKDAQ